MAPSVLNLECEYRGGKDIRFNVDANGNVRELPKSGNAKGRPVGILAYRKGESTYFAYQATFIATGEQSDWKDVKVMILAWLADRVREQRYGVKA